MPIGVTNKQYYEDIADAIREKNGSNSLYKPSEMAQAVLDIETGGGGGDVTDPVEYRKIHRDKGWPYIPLPSEMKDPTSPYYESGDCIYMLYDARGEMANPAFNLTYTNATCIAYKIRAGADYLTPSSQINANKITSFTLNGLTYKFFAKANHPITSELRIDKDNTLVFFNGNVFERIPITTNANPTNLDLINDLTSTSWTLPTTPTLPNVTSSNASEFSINFSAKGQSFDLLQLSSDSIHYINTLTSTDVIAYTSGAWVSGYDSVQVIDGDDVKLGWLVDWFCKGTLSATNETISITSAWQDPSIVIQSTETLATSGVTNYLSYSYNDPNWNSYDYILLVITGTITDHSVNFAERFNNVSYSDNASSELLEVSGKCASSTISVVSSSKRLHQNLEYYSFDGIVNTSMGYMFQNCYSLQAIPELDTSKITDMGTMFSNCCSLQAIPQLDTSKVTNMSNMFQTCYSLQAIPQLDTSNVTSMSYMVNTCYSLQAIPQLDTSNVTSMSYMVNECRSLKTIPQLDTSKVTNMNSMCSGCYSLQAIPQLDTSKVTNMSNMFTSCTSLQKCGVYNSKKAFSLSAATMLPKSELVNILQNLGVVTTATTLTLGTTNLNKLTAAEKAIATKKGWTLA